VFGKKYLKACSLGLSAISQQYFSLRTNQPPATSRNQPAVLFSQNKPAPAISHQPTEQAPGPPCVVNAPTMLRRQVRLLLQAKNPTRLATPNEKF
jgi:hypothetical protein